MAEKKWEEGMLKIALAPSQHGGVESNDQRRIAGFFRALQQTRREFVIFTPVKLEPARRAGHSLADFFDGARRHGTENEWNAERCGGAGDSEFAFRMNDAVHADRAK